MEGKQIICHCVHPRFYEYRHVFMFGLFCNLRLRFSPSLNLKNLTKINAIFISLEVKKKDLTIPGCFVLDTLLDMTQNLYCFDVCWS